MYRILGFLLNLTLYERSSLYIYVGYLYFNGTWNFLWGLSYAVFLIPTTTATHATSTYPYLFLLK